MATTGMSAEGPPSGALGQLWSVGAWGPISDAQVLGRFVESGDPIAFEVLIHRHGPRVLRVCRAVLADEHESHDAFQATFLVLARRPSAVRNQASVAAWLHGTALRIARKLRDRTRRRRAYEQPEGPVLEEQPAPESDHRPDPLARSAIHEELARLPDHYREPILLCYFDGLTHEQAATRMDCPVGTVRSRLARARRMLKRRLERRGVGLGAALIPGAGKDLGALGSTPLIVATTPSLRLVTLVVEAAARIGRGQTLAEVTSGSIVTLVTGTLRMLTLSNLKWTAAVFGLGLLGLGGTAAMVSATGQDGDSTAPKPAPQPEVVADETPSKPEAPEETEMTPEVLDKSELRRRERRKKILEYSRSRARLIVERIAIEAELENYRQAIRALPGLIKEIDTIETSLRIENLKLQDMQNQLEKHHAAVPENGIVPQNAFPEEALYENLEFQIRDQTLSIEALKRNLSNSEISYKKAQFVVSELEARLTERIERYYALAIEVRDEQMELGVNLGEFEFQLGPAPVIGEGREED